MYLAETCSPTWLVIDRKVDDRPCPARKSDRCGDCNVKPGGIHHCGCDQERCPGCGRQLIMCPCGEKLLTFAM